VNSQQIIAHYRITSKLGEGGMGEVWRATDTKLYRDVAIKILPEAFAQDADRMARFEREAKVLASLNHPNIAAIYGVEERALVMELVEGETLAGPLPLDTALDYARQIAEALEAAHEKGIIHRDLKPANIKVTPQGVVKVLDFGLAAVTQPSQSEVTLTISPTQTGMILGTAAYMSPEQARGKAVDKQADIWAFGVVLYEMLTGEQLFQGETISDTLAAVLTKEPDWNRVPMKVRRLLQSCLQKDPKQRLQAIGDWRLPLEEMPERAGAAKSRLPWAVTAGALAIALAAVSWALWNTIRRIEPTLQPLVRLDVDLGNDVSLGSVYGTDVILSPDGSRIVFVSQSRLFTRRLDQPNAVELPGTAGANGPFFSPDGRWIGFFTTTELKKVSVQGGAAITLCELPSGKGGSWMEDGSIITARVGSGLLRISSAGGALTPLTELAPGEAHHRWAQVLPGGKAVLFTAFARTGGLDAASIEVMSMADHRRKTLRGGTFGRYLPSGHLVYVNRGTLFALPFDVDRLELRGAPAPVLDAVGYSTMYGSAQLDFSPNGMVAYRSSGEGDGLATMQWLDSAGQTHPLLTKSADYSNVELSPDGDRLAFTSKGDVWVYEWRRESMTRLTSDGGHTRLVWSPDGRYIVFNASGGMYWTRADGGAKPEWLLTEGKDLYFPGSFTSGKRLVFVKTESGRYSIWTVALESVVTGLRAGKPEVFLQTPFLNPSASFSPDGRWIAYQSNESGVDQVYVRAFPDTGGKVAISIGGGMYPRWSPNRHELFFRTPDQHIMVVGYTVKGDSFQPDKPRLWSEKRLANIGAVGSRSYSVAPDGKRIAALMPAETAEAQKAENHVIFLLNFFDYLRQRVPVGGK
jgi:serine/threonine-protein kinase